MHAESFYSIAERVQLLDATWTLLEEKANYGEILQNKFSNLMLLYLCCGKMHAESFYSIAERVQ